MYIKPQPLQIAGGGAESSGNIHAACHSGNVENDALGAGFSQPEVPGYGLDVVSVTSGTKYSSVIGPAAVHDF